jgi:hypothetical protein
LETALPFDFGEFSVRSLGVTVNLPQALGELYPFVAAGLLNGDPALSTSYFAGLLDKVSGPDTAFTLVGYASAVAHELRHYHDYLATPFGGSVMVDHVLASRYVLPAAYVLADEPTVGVPLQQWQALTPRLMRAYKSRTRTGQFNDRPPEALARFTDSADAILKQVRLKHGRSVNWPELDIETTHLLEVSALAIQVEEIERRFGRERAVSFAQYVNQLGVETYTRVFTLFNHFANELSPGRFFSPAVISGVIFFALCGTSEADKEWSHPPDRLMAVLGYLQASRDYPTDDNILAILDHVAVNVCHVPTIRESLAASVKLHNELSEGLPRLAPGGAAKLNDQGLIDGYRGWAKAHEHMVSAILEDPMSYIDPARYLQNSERWVAAPQYLGGTRFATSGESRLIAQLKQAGWKVVWGYGDQAVSPDEVLGVGLMAAPTMTAGQPVLADADATHLSHTTWVVYLLWSTDMLNPVQRAVGANLLKLANPNWDVLLL